MAEDLVHKVLDIAISAALEEYKLARDAKEELQNLENVFRKIQAVLQDAESKQLKSEGVRAWLRDLKDISYEIDDLLDEFATENLRLEVEGDGPAPEKKKVWDSLLCCVHFSRSLVRDNKMAHEIKTFRERLDEIAKQRRDLGLVELGNFVEGGGASWDVQNKNREAGHMVDSKQIFGRDEAKKDIIMLLTGKEEREMEVSVVPIVGVGGMGKTTVAQLVFNDNEILEHFSLRLWLYVGMNFDATKVLQNIVESLATLTLSRLQEDVETKLKDKRFLIVLDDLWSHNSDEWKKLWLPLASGGKGSKVVITTRNEMVGRVENAMAPIVLKGLSEDDSLSILKKMAFVNISPDRHPKFEKIAKEIIPKFNGLPLAAKTVGGLLSQKLDEDEWRRILKSEIWELPQEENDVLPALRLSYEHLPPHLKQCFAYCSIFPKGHRFYKDNFVKVWMAQGFIHPQGRERVEDKGSNYFENLVRLSFFEIVEGYYVMHDLVHDLAKLISLDECISLEGDRWPEMPQKVRHLSCFLDYSLELAREMEMVSINFEKYYKSNHLRTFMFEQSSIFGPTLLPLDLFTKFKYLRVLELGICTMQEVPSSIGEIKHLRYLCISSGKVRELPETLCCLYNLQTLIIKETCWYLEKLPEGLRNLINMRHLEAKKYLISGITGIGKLKQLQKLDTFKVLNENGHRIRELEDMNELRGGLCICNLENVESKKDAATAKLTNKEHLQSLRLTWDNDMIVDLQEDVRLDEEVLEGLQPHSNLQELVIQGYSGVHSPTWMTNGMLSNIESIGLEYCWGWEVLPPFEQLPFLRSLKLVRMEGIKRLFHGASTPRFQRLKNLELSKMPEWNEWFGIDDGQSWFPNLRKLVIRQCPKLRRLPALPPTLKKIKLVDVGLDALPEWQGFQEERMLTPSSSIIGSLCRYSIEIIEIITCPNLKSLDAGGLLQCRLMALQILRIRDCREIVSLPERWFEEGGSLISLKTLELSSCPKLLLSSPRKELLLQPPSSLLNLTIDDLISFDDMQAELFLKSLPSSLINLCIEKCHGITTLSRMALGHLIALQDLKIIKCSGTVELEFQGLVSLFYLDIRDCPGLISLPWEALRDLTSLNKLNIRDCKELTLAGLQALVSLKRLSIFDCPKLTATDAPPLSPSSLQLDYLHLENTNIIFLPLSPTHQPILRNISSLRILWIRDCPTFTSLSVVDDPGIRLISSLKDLHISNCVNLLSLPELQTFSSLENLEISNCPSIRAFPEGGFFPSSLQCLKVQSCPLLKKWLESNWRQFNRTAGLQLHSLGPDEIELRCR